MRRALVLGANGFCGRHLVGWLRGQGLEVFGADIAPTCVEEVERYWTVDLRAQDDVERLIREARPDQVYNLAGTATGSADEICGINFLGSVHLMEAVRLYAPEAGLLMVGSAAEYGIVDQADLPVTEDHCCKPVGHYAVSKHAMTLAALSYFRQNELRVVVARPFNIVGAGIPGSLVLGAILRRAKEALQSKGEAVVKIGNLDTRRDFVAVEDVVEAYGMIVRQGCWGEVINICSGRAHSIKNLVQMALSRATRPVRLEVDPALVRPSDVPVMYGSYEKAKTLIGFEPRVSLGDSVAAAWDYEMRAG